MNSCMKKIKWIIIIFIIVVIIAGICFLYNIIGNSKYDLRNISETQRQKIIELLNCAEISNDIELKELQIPKVYRDIYYNVYFKTNNKEIKEHVSKFDTHTNIYGRDLKELGNNNYCCVIYREDDKSIELLEAIANGNEIIELKNEQAVELTKNNNPQDVTQKIINNNVVRSGIINNIDKKNIYYSDSDSNKLYFEKNAFSCVNGRTCKEMDLEDLKIGDYIYPSHKQIMVFRNLSGEELNQELLYNFTLTDDERIMFVNSIELTNINIMDNNTAIVKITYGDIIGEDLTNERFSTLVQFDSNTKYYSKGNNINGVNDLDNAKGNINSIILKKDTINKKNPATVVSFESDDT